MKGFKGYISSRFNDGIFTHQRVQNLVIREYVRKIGKVFLLSATEYYMDDSYLMLKSVLDEMDSMGGLVFYSTHLLPKNKNYRNDILKKLLENQVEVHFALEEIALQHMGDIGIINDIFMARELSAKLSFDMVKG